jgi:hypothetical protein
MNIFFFEYLLLDGFLFLIIIKDFKQSIRVLKTSIFNMLFDLFHELVLFIFAVL